MSDPIQHLTDHNFNTTVSESKLPVLVDFWAPWCQPCRAIAPLLEQIAQELHTQLMVAKVNVDDNPALPAQHGVRGIPTLMVFRNGQPVATHVGALSKQQLEQWITPHLDAPSQAASGT